MRTASEQVHFSSSNACELSAVTTHWCCLLVWEAGFCWFNDSLLWVRPEFSFLRFCEALRFSSSSFYLLANESLILEGRYKELHCQVQWKWWAGLVLNFMSHFSWFCTSCRNRRAFQHPILKVFAGVILKSSGIFMHGCDDGRVKLVLASLSSSAQWP